MFNDVNEPKLVVNNEKKSTSIGDRLDFTLFKLAQGRGQRGGHWNAV